MFINNFNKYAKNKLLINIKIVYIPDFYNIALFQSDVYKLLRILLFILVVASVVFQIVRKFPNHTQKSINKYT